MHVQPIGLVPEVEALLTECGLPVTDLASSSDLNLLGVLESGRLVGVVGVEVYGRLGLLRSLAVAPARRNVGMGRRLADRAEILAKDRDITALYLLTTTASVFFRGHGYKPVSRHQAPDAIAASAQFSTLCPASSLLMRKSLAGNASPRSRFA